MSKIKKQKSAIGNHNSVLLLVLYLLPIAYCLLPVVLYPVRKLTNIILSVMTIVFLIIIGFSNGVYAQGVDIVFVESNGKITEKSGTIIKETYKGIEIRSTTRGTEMIPLEQLAKGRRIHYKDKPAKYTEAERLQTKGDYPAAIAAYTKVLEDIKTLRSIFKQHAFYNRAVCLQLSKQYDEAIQDYDALLKEVEDTRYLKEVYFNKVDCLLGKNKVTDALKVIEKARSKAREISEPVFSLQLDLRKGLIFESISKFIEARVIYRRLEAQRNYPEIAGQATLGLARMSLAEGKLKDAEKLFRKAIEKSQIPAILAMAYNGLGDCLLAQASTTSERKLYKEALFAYLHTKLLYLPDPGEPTNAYEKSIFQAAYCLEILAKDLTEEKATSYSDYARTLYQELIDKYPGSPYRPKAEERLR